MFSSLSINNKYLHKRFKHLIDMILRNFARSLFRINRPPPPNVRPLDYAVCIDIECTCDSPIQIHPMEVIEIACIKLDLTTTKKEPSNLLNKNLIFHSYAKPQIHPKLTLFCQELTGIMQNDIDNSPTISQLTRKMMEWLKYQKLVDDQWNSCERFAFASCGNFDLKILSPIIKKYEFNNNLELPIYFKEWINVKKTFVNHKKEWPKGLYHMTELLGLEPFGRLHSAMDDCINLARVVECLHLDGCKLYVTNKEVFKTKTCPEIT